MLNRKIITAPMAGVTDFAYRKILKKFGPDLLFTEMINSKLLLNDDNETNNILIKTEDFDKEGAQVFGSNIEDIKNSFIKLEKIGFKHINLNMGCPKTKIVKKGAGSELLLVPNEIEKLLINLKKELDSKTNISLKIRTSYKNFSNPEIFIKLASDFNLDFICIHGKSTEQQYEGLADWDKIKALSLINRNTNLIGNGDIFSYNDYITYTKDCKIDGVMLARGIIGNPFLIKDIKEGNVIPKSIKEVKEILLEHLYNLAELKGEIKASLEINKFIKPYFKDFSVSESLLDDIILTKDLSEKKIKIRSI